MIFIHQKLGVIGSASQNQAGSGDKSSPAVQVQLLSGKCSKYGKCSSCKKGDQNSSTGLLKSIVSFCIMTQQEQKPGKNNTASDQNKRAFFIKERKIKECGNKKNSEDRQVRITIPEAADRFK